VSYLFDTKVQLAVLVILLAAAIVSFLYWPASRLQNLIAEAASIALGVWLTVTLVARLLEIRRRERWKEVGSEVFRPILSDVMDIAWAYARRCYPVIWRHSLLKGSEPPQDAADDLKEMLEEMRNKGAGWWVQELFTDTEWRFHHLRDVLSPRLMDVGDEQKLIQLLTRIDSRYTTWKDCLRMLEREIKQLGSPFNESSVQSLSTPEEIELDAYLWLKDSFRAAMDTLEDFIEVYEYLVRERVANPR